MNGTEKLEVLKTPPFNREEAAKKISEARQRTDEGINAVNATAKEHGIYVRIDESQEQEKSLKAAFPFLHNSGGIHYINYYAHPARLLDDVEREYNNRIYTALMRIGFQRINEKKQIITCKKEYYLHLYPLQYVAEWKNDISKESECVEVLKEYKNGNVDFRFKEAQDYETFATLVFTANDITLKVVNGASDETIAKYKEWKKTPHLNEYNVLYEWMESHDISTFGERLNIHLINKAWGCE